METSVEVIPIEKSLNIEKDGTESPPITATNSLASDTTHSLKETS